MGTITILNSKEYKERPVPEVGKEYHIFDDGKIKPSRHYTAKITKLIPFAEAYEITDIYNMWKDDVENCGWLYAKVTDYFVKATATCSEEPQYFVRTRDGGWFSLGWWGARLDIDGSLYEQMQEYLKDIRQQESN